MLYKLLSILLLLLFGCNSHKKTQSQNEVTETYWEQISFTPSQPESYPKTYFSFTLNPTAFKEALQSNLVFLPNLEGTLKEHNVTENNVMSPELAAKFPNIKSYEGSEIGNNLCKNRINVKDEKIDIAVFCNDVTYFIKPIVEKEKIIYIVYNKADVPKGVGFFK